MAKAPEIVLTEQKEKVLHSWLRSGKTEQRMVERARIVLYAADGKTNLEIARLLNTRRTQFRI
ncbi:hypothetical protein GWO43_25860 [candidate division KSB1 bacterium]|nr:hypothetical protein [candidate division KSB1 bacterium]NIT74238.1 hypothetical protein [candidate division KSB1 bacterium]NIX73918.1 hypothetical protein [candidate division KSB1 bacterium]